VRAHSAFESVSFCASPWIFKAAPPQREGCCHHKFPKIPTGNGKPQHAVTKTFRVRVEGEKECIVDGLEEELRIRGKGERERGREEILLCKQDPAQSIFGCQ